MFQTDVSTQLIQAMKELLPSDSNLANTLMDILYLGKEATYRRLRGEVPFTLNEAVAISRKMEISLDHLIGTHFDQNALFNLYLLNEKRSVETYTGILAHYMDLFERLVEEPESEFSISSNSIPQTLYLKYDMLSKFCLFKWMYQHEKINVCRRFEALELPYSLLKMQKELVAVSQLFQRTHYIWDLEIIPRLVKDILYFREIRLISKESVQMLQKELFLLIDELEEMTAQGKFKTDKEVQIYISNINFEATYSYVETTHYNLGMICIFSINSLTGRDDAFFQSLKKWIQSLKRYSTLISESSDFQRIRFVENQREIIRCLSDK